MSPGFEVREATEPANAASHNIKRSPLDGLDRLILDTALVGALVFVFSLVGIATRMSGALAAFWPANAVLLCLMIRTPRLSTPAPWLAAFCAYVAADVITGDQFGVTFWLSWANIAGAFAGYLVARHFSLTGMQPRPTSLIGFFGVCLVASGVSAIVGSGAGQVIFGRRLLDALQFWFTTELVNYVVVLPLLLTAPTLREARAYLSSPRDWLSRDYRQWLPLLALILSAAVSALWGGAGAFGYAMPALLWCALTYRLFITAAITLTLSVWEVIAVSAGLLPFPLGDDTMLGTMSVRLAIALIALGPIAVSSVNDARNEVVRQLQHAATHDSLTGTLLRGAWVEEAEALLLRSIRDGADMAVLMLDIDNFKKVNDSYGHATGDRALLAFVDAVRQSTDDKALFGRLGGEEFALAFSAPDAQAMERMVESIRSQVALANIDATDGRTLKITVSGGLATTALASMAAIDTLLMRADRALYLAKSAGRNCIIADDPTATRMDPVARLAEPLAGRRL